MVSDSRAGMDGKAENSIQNTTEYEGNQSTACHIPDIGKKIRFCQLTDKKRTGGNRRTPVPEKNPGQDRTAGKKRRNTHTVGHSHTDHADGGGTSKGGSRKERDQTAQKKRRQQHHGRSTDGRCIIYDIGNGTTGTPDRCEHTDQQQSQQNIFYCENSVPGKTKHLFYTFSMDQSIGKEQNVPEYQGKNNRSTGDYTCDETGCKQRQK